MGFPSVPYCIVLPSSLVRLIKFIDVVKLLLSAVLSFFGLMPDETSSPAITPSSIKSTLPVVEFANLAAVAEEEGAVVCAVCLGELEARDEVRQLGNCRHAFHRGCIDKWVDLGQTTCPLCRSQLLPRGKEARRLLLVS